MKAKAAGSGRSPSIFTYATNDTQTEVQSQYYFGEAATFLSLGDFIYVSYDTSTDLYVVSNSSLKDGGVHQVDVQAVALFTGDTGATDAAGVTSERVSLAIQGADGLFDLFTYRNNTDTKALILAADYFIVDGTYLEQDDIIYVVANDGAFMIRVLTATPTGVTVEEIIFA